MAEFRNRGNAGVFVNTPCPRCRSRNINCESHPLTGTMVNCGDCGARSGLANWNEGIVTLTRNENSATYWYVHEVYVRPKTDVIETPEKEASRG